MIRFAAVANAGSSHHMAFCAIGRELQARGHRFLMFGTGFQAARHRSPDVPIEIIPSRGTDAPATYSHSIETAGTVPIRVSITYMKQMAELLCRELPALFRKHRIDFVLADQEEPGAATAADLAQLPYASICCSLPLNAASDIPPGFLPWPYSGSLYAVLRNSCGYAIRNAVIRGVNQTLNTHRRAARLAPYRCPDDSFSTRAQICQLVPEFDFPRRRSLPCMHCVGPYQRSALFPVPFPYDRLNGLPLVYASFGTAFGNNVTQLQAVAVACAGLPVQLVISLGVLALTSQPPQFSGQPIVVAYAPQREILKRAALMVTHGGLNSTMEALSLGVPLLAMPFAGDQLGVGSRITWHGVGHVLAPAQRSSTQIQAAILAIQQDPSFRAAAGKLSCAIGRTGGAYQAAAILEHAAAATPAAIRPSPNARAASAG